MLPRILRTLVERRRQVKSLIAQTDKNSPELVQVDKINSIRRVEEFERFLLESLSSMSSPPIFPFHSWIFDKKPLN